MTRRRQESPGTASPHGRRHALRGLGIVRELLRDAGILPSREAPRHWHWLALISAVVYQCLWSLALFWLVYIRFLIVPLAPDGDGAGDGGVIEVTFFDRSPTTQPWLTPLPEPLPAPLPQPLPEPVPETRPAPPPEPIPDPVPAPATPLMVTEVNETDSDFTLHIPEFQHLEMPVLPATPPPAVQRELPVADIPLLQRPEIPPPSTLPIPALSAEVSTPELALPERDIPAPLPELELRPLPTHELPTLDMNAQVPEIEPREIALTPLEPTPPPASESELTLPTPTSEPVVEIDLTPPSERIPSTPPPSDAWELPATSATTTETGSGLLDAQGRPRLAGTGNGRPGSGLPPGTIMEDYANIDRMGSWRKRASTEYQPNQLDQLWVPHENILEEWVRRSIKNIMIPIPGTNKVIRCTVVLLMLGGGCGITDPNLLDIEATSRPPPDIPFKPELHEDQNSLGTPVPTQGQKPPETM